MEELTIKLRLLKAKFKQQIAFSMNIDMQVASKVTEAEIKELELIIKEREGNQANSENANCAIFDVSKQSELLIAFLKWRKGEQLTSETITEIDNFLADKSNL